MKDPVSKQIIGALVSGDIVNGKLPIVKGTLKAIGGGYSAIYSHKPTGEFAMATSIDRGVGKNLEQAQSQVLLPDTELLEAAIAAKGESVTKRSQVGN